MSRFVPETTNSDAPTILETATSRRRFFGGLTAIGAAAAFPGYVSPALAEAKNSPLTIGNTLQGAPSRMHPSFVKDVGRLQDLNPTNQGGA